MYKLKDILNEVREDLVFTKPNFEYEWEEASRYPDLFPNLETWLKAAKFGRVEDIDCSMNISNTDMCDGDLEDLEPEKVLRALQAIKRGVVELPIIVNVRGRYELIAGNTRLTALATHGLPTKAWVINMGMLNEVGQIENPFKWKFDFVDDDGNYFYSFHTPQNEYSVGITWNGNNSYEILFNTAEEMGKDTGEHVATRVLSTVFEIMLDFIKKESPDDLVIRPTEEKRGRIYRHYAEKNIPNGYKLVSIGDVQHWIKK